MKILVTGARGFVGHKLMEHYGDAIAAPSFRNASEDEVRRIVEESGADVIIHTAAISDIGTCEKNPEASYHANVTLPCYLAKASGRRKLICFSSDQVYSACAEAGPYTEETVNPGNLYAREKLEMEQKVLDIQPDAVLLRAEWMYDWYEERSNYFMTLLRAEGSVAFSSGQYRGVTYLKEVAENMDRVITLPGGVYNFGSETRQSMAEITKAFAEYIGKDIQITEGPEKHNLWMDCSKARNFGVVFSDVLDGLKRCAEDYRDRLEAL